MLFFLFMVAMVVYFLFVEPWFYCKYGEGAHWKPPTPTPEHLLARIEEQIALVNSTLSSKLK